jgi:hypothetical protein
MILFGPDAASLDISAIDSLLAKAEALQADPWLIDWSVGLLAWRGTDPLERVASRVEDEQAARLRYALRLSRRQTSLDRHKLPRGREVGGNDCRGLRCRLSSRAEDGQSYEQHNNSWHRLGSLVSVQLDQSS